MFMLSFFFVVFYGFLSQSESVQVFFLIFIVC